MSRLNDPYAAACNHLLVDDTVLDHENAFNRFLRTKVRLRILMVKLLLIQKPLPLTQMEDILKGVKKLSGQRLWTYFSMVT